MSMNERILSVAEKPSVAKELTAIFCQQAGIQSNRRPGFSPYNQCFDIERCAFRTNMNAKMTMTSVTGHLMGIDFEQRYKGWNSCAPIELFDAPISRSVGEAGKNIEKTLEREAKQCNILMLWLDCDLEGENIAYEVIEVCKRSNPRMQVSLEEGVIEGGYYSILVLSYFMWSDTLDSSGVLLSYPLISLASPMTNILISTLKYTHLYAYLCRSFGLVFPPWFLEIFSAL